MKIIFFETVTSKQIEFFRENPRSDRDSLASKSKAFLKESKKDMLKSFKTIKRKAKEQRQALMGMQGQPQKRKITKADIANPRTSQFV